MSARKPRSGVSTNLDRAVAVTRALLEAGLQPTLNANVQSGNNWREGEYDVVIEGSSLYGVIHEEIVAALAIAEEHGGRLWLSSRAIGGDGKLAILFDYKHPPGPIPESPMETTRRRSRTKAKGAAAS